MNHRDDFELIRHSFYLNPSIMSKNNGLGDVFDSNGRLSSKNNEKKSNDDGTKKTVKYKNDEPDDDKSPYDRSNLYKKYIFTYLRNLNGYLRKKSEWNSDDFNDQTPRDCLSKNVAKGLEYEWHRELTDCHPNQSASLLRAIRRAYGAKILLANMFFLLSECVFEPIYFYFCIQLVHLVNESWTQKEGIKTLELRSTGLQLNDTTSAIDVLLTDDNLINELYFNAIGFMIFLTLTTISTHPYVWRLSMISLRMRSALGQMIYKKSLKIDKSSKSNSTKQAISLISKDLDLIEYNLGQLVWIISGPLECFILTTLLATVIGAKTALVALSLSIVFTLIRTYLNINMRRHTRLASADSDIRVSLVNETLKAIKILRMYAWTEPLYKKIQVARWNELESRKYKMFVTATETALYFLGCTGVGISTVAFGYYYMSIQINQLVITYIYLVVMIHQRTLSRYLPQGILSYLDLTIVFERIGRFLCEQEVVDREHDEIQFTSTLDRTNSIELNDLSAKWLESEKLTLDRIRFSAKPSELIVIVGKVGTGKSSLIHTILNELSIIEGSIRLNGKISYASQEPWVFSGTIRDNILFGAEMNLNRYLEVLQVCSLLPDLRSFKRNDSTEVGQRGVTLSGGQKARINLARCLYHEADIYLLDDPLSAVDAHVSKHLFHKAIKGFLANKTVLLATHQLQYARFANKILALNERQSGVFGTINELIRRSSTTFRDAFGPVVPKAKELSSSINNDHQSSCCSSLMEVTGEEDKLLDERIMKEIRESYLAGLDHGNKQETTRNEMKDTIELTSGHRVWEAFVFYVKNSGGSKEYWLFLFLNITLRVFFLGNSTWMNYWAGYHGSNNDAFGDTTIEQMDFNQAILIACATWLCLLVLTVSRSVQTFTFTFRAAKRIHQKLMKSLLWAKMRFYDLVPPGQVINRVSADLSYMDTTHVSLLDDLSLTLISSAFMFFTIVVTEVKLSISLMIICYIGYRVFVSYIDLTNTVKKVDGVRKSELYTHVSITLDGLTTIRASDRSDMFAKLYHQIQDNSSSVAFIHTSVKRLIITQLDWSLVFFYATLIGLDILDASKGEGLYAFIGLNLVMQLSRNTQYVMNRFVELYTRIEALNRIKEYCSIEPEISDKEKQNNNLRASFKEGRVEFVGVSLKYEQSGEAVLRNVSFIVEAREKIGIVGRTGAGKSSLIAVLFRLYHFEGFVEIDGQDTKCLSLDSLRQSIGIIPQDPELLSGSLRHNLDPLDEYSDESLWRALDAVQLKQLVSNNARLLELEVNDSGSNFSVGQRQLICLARAILRRNKLLVLDEATANVDPETDQLIQQAIRKEFADCTVMTVAHKLSTIIDSDRIMVIDKGRLCEFDTPGRLLEKNGLFASMIVSSGTQTQHLKTQLSNRLSG